jgi:hypothetical protein
MASGTELSGKQTTLDLDWTGQLKERDIENTTGRLYLLRDETAGKHGGGVEAAEYGDKVSGDDHNHNHSREGEGRFGTPGR